MDSGYQCGLTARHRHGGRCRRPEADAPPQRGRGLANDFEDRIEAMRAIRALISSP